MQHPSARRNTKFWTVGAMLKQSLAGVPSGVAIHAALEKSREVFDGANPKAGDAIRRAL
jgi:hypothetical protein